MFRLTVARLHKCISLINWNTTDYLTLLFSLCCSTELFFKTTLHGPHRKHCLLLSCIFLGMFTTPLHSNGNSIFFILDAMIWLWVSKLEFLVLIYISFHSVFLGAKKYPKKGKFPFNQTFVLGLHLLYTVCLACARQVLVTETHFRSKKYRNMNETHKISRNTIMMVHQHNYLALLFLLS